MRCICCDDDDDVALSIIVSCDDDVCEFVLDPTNNRLFVDYLDLQD